MAAPTIQTTAESATTTAGTSHTVTLPSGIVAGDLILILGAHVGSSTFNAVTGWTEFLDENAGAVRNAYGVARRADGTEGASLALTSSASEKPAFIAYRISGADEPALQAPTLSTVATGASSNPNATNCNPGTSKDYLWISFFTLAGEEADDDTWCTAAPASYTGLLQKTAGVAGTNTSAIIATASRQLTASAEDAGSFTIVVTPVNTWRAFTLAVHPQPPDVPVPILAAARR